MADNLDLLLRVRGDASGAKNAVEETRKAITQLKDRIREVRTESDVGFRTERIQALNTRLTELNKTHQAAKDAAKKTAEAHKDFESALSTLSPRLGNFAGLLTGSVGPTTALALGMTAVAGAVIAAGAAVFQITKSAAEFQGKMFDLSQQTGVSVETLSTLEVVAKTTGGSIDSITASLGIFQKKLEDALDPTSKEAALLKTLGIETNNTEEAFRQALTALAKMPEGFQQTALALELFGRGGKQVLAILKEMDGDLDGTTEKLREMGILITTDAAKAADQFNDQLALLGFQFRSLTAIIGSEAMPTILKAMEDLSIAISDNRESISTWADVLVNAGKGALFLGQSVSGLIPLLRQAGSIQPDLGSVVSRLFQVTPLGGGVVALSFLGRAAGGAFGGVTGGAGGESPDAPSTTTGVGGKGGKNADKARAEAERRAAKELQLIQREAEEAARVHRLALERERELDLISIEEWRRQAEDAAIKQLQTQQEVFEQEKINAQKFIKNKQDLALALREIDLKDEKARNDFILTLARVQDEAQKRRDKATIETERQLSQIRIAQREGEIERIGILLDRQAIQESDALTRILEIEKEAHAERILLINTELKLLTTSASRAEELTNQKAEAEQRYTDRFLRLTRERIDALNQEAAAQSALSVREPAEIDFINIGATVEEQVGIPPPPQETFDLWKDAFNELRDIGANAMADLAFGVGSLIQNWVLLGETGPKAMRKLVASVLAGVAAQAAVKAIYELAEGFAMLFVNPAAAAAHFTSAAIFGSIAGVAAIAGRAVAGDAFQRTGKDGREGTSSGGTGQLNPLTLQRNQPQTQTIRVEIVTKDSEFGRAITAHVLNDVTTAGPLREAFANDGVLP